ncbi:MAG: lytic transglycosylase domain-containing protein [Rhodovarius sp.]|nr:lytic transglycosylase domain-containing protein [Rhodovarius sp.]
MRFASFGWGLGRAGLAVLLLLGLAACGGGPRPVTSSAPGVRSYDPPGPPHDPWGPWIREAAERFDVPERWIREVMRQESGGRPYATSPAGAIGLMQVMPSTYRELRARYGLGEDPYHPYDNIMAGTAYMREMYDLFGSPAFLAAYNAGPRRLENYLYNRQGLPAETRNYVARVGPEVIRHSPNRRAPPEVYAAAEIPLHIPPGPRRMDAATMLALREQQAIRERFAAAGRPAEGEGTGGGVFAAAPRRGAEQRIIVASMDPIPDGSTPEGASALAAAEARQAALAAPQRREAPVGHPGGGRHPPPAASWLAAARPTPPPSPAPAPAVAASRPALVAELAAVARRRGRGGPPQAAPPPAARRPGAPGGAWAIQVGAFSTEAQARAAAQAAAVGGGRVEVRPVQVGRAILFRARVIGLSQPAAQQACDRLRARGGCLVLSPDQQG